MKFDYIVGNPPYQDEKTDNARKPPIYNFFMDEAYKISDKVELITPARFLFNAGQTKKTWNRKMLDDPHLKVLYYEPNRELIFPNTDIKGGIAITYRDATKKFGAISTFQSFQEFEGITEKVMRVEKENEMFDSIVSSRGNYRLTDKFFKDYPSATKRIGAGTANMVVSNIFEKIPEAFSEEFPSENKANIALTGRVNNKRVIRYIAEDYIINNPFLETYNVLFPEANGNGTFGEVLSPTLIAEPHEGATDTFLSIGRFETRSETEAAQKYLKTKFVRTLLGIHKATQHTPKSVWQTVPIQNFTSVSDIDWSQSIADIDRQLYAKYGLDDSEIEFIETHVKAME